MTKNAIKLLKKIRRRFPIEYFPNGVNPERENSECYRLRVRVSWDYSYHEYFTTKRGDFHKVSTAYALKEARQRRINIIRILYNRDKKVRKTDGKIY